MFLKNVLASGVPDCIRDGNCEELFNGKTEELVPADFTIPSQAAEQTYHSWIIWGAIVAVAIILLATYISRRNIRSNPQE